MTVLTLCIGFNMQEERGRKGERRGKEREKVRFPRAPGRKHWCKSSCKRWGLLRRIRIQLHFGGPRRLWPSSLVRASYSLCSSIIVEWTEVVFFPSLPSSFLGTYRLCSEQHSLSTRNIRSRVFQESDEIWSFYDAGMLWIATCDNRGFWALFPGQGSFDLCVILQTADEGLTEYLKQVMAQLSDWLIHGSLQKLVLVISSALTNTVMERWAFDIETDKESVTNGYGTRSCHDLFI